MKRQEAMLLMQAHTLDEIFNALAREAASNIGTNRPAVETCLKLALKSQSQCRTTLEALAAIKNPPVIFAKQANFASGHQQINNGLPGTHTEKLIPSSTRTRANKNKIQIKPNELLTELPHATLDSGRTGETIGINSELEAVAEVHRSANGGR